MLLKSFFNRDSCEVAKDLLGKIIRFRNSDIWLSSQIIETEAYYKNEKGSHASLGYTDTRRALFMPPGTIYMYYARGGDSLNISCKGKGNAVLIKSGIPYLANKNDYIISVMQKNNPIPNSDKLREPMKLCSGQILLCKSLGIKVSDWNQKQFDKHFFYIDDVGNHPKYIVNASRLGIPIGRDEHLLYRFIDFDYIKYCTKNPLTERKNREGRDYFITKKSPKE
jgi:DNA-3-methyladenine glycosylase